MKNFMLKQSFWTTLVDSQSRQIPEIGVGPGLVSTSFDRTSSKKHISKLKEPKTSRKPKTKNTFFSRMDCDSVKIQGNKHLP